QLQAECAHFLASAIRSLQPSVSDNAPPPRVAFGGVTNPAQPRVVRTAANQAANHPAVTRSNSRAPKLSFDYAVKTAAARCRFGEQNDPVSFGIAGCRLRLQLRADNLQTFRSDRLLQRHRSKPADGKAPDIAQPSLRQGPVLGRYGDSIWTVRADEGPFREPPADAYLRFQDRHGINARWPALAWQGDRRRRFRTNRVAADWRRETAAPSPAI